MSGRGRTAPGGALRPRVWPMAAPVLVCSPSSKGQGDGQEARQRAGPGHGPDVRQRPDGSRRRAAPPCVAPAALVLIYCPQLQGSRAAARRPASGPVRATARMSGRGRTAPGGDLHPRVRPLGGSGAGLL
ncbi:hypothetical protein B5F19_14265 [Pseudoflavonifractor sp. An184]|nr:hypothetical protein B5F19_14265 [Pseudoflavonifractor sp. An184]